MLLVAALVLGASDLRAYRTWTCITPKAVDMAPAIALTCIGPASWDSSAQNPHLRKRFKVWVSPLGKAAMAKPLRREVKPGLWEKVPIHFPEGTTIVKEKFDATDTKAFFDRKPPKPLPSEPELLTIMVKGARGSKPSTGDWSYYVADPSLKRLDATQEARCAGCHAARPEYDFTFRNYGSLTH